MKPTGICYHINLDTQSKESIMKNAVVLLSGGLDSTTVLAIAQNADFRIFAMSFDYGQKHRIELDSAKKIVAEYNIAHHIIAAIDLTIFGQSALTGDIEVPKRKSVNEIQNEIPVTYVPARNTIFLSYAVAYAEVNQAQDIFIGVNAVDYSGYPDCRPEYITAYQQMANLATKAGIEGQQLTIHTPLINLSKSEIIAKGMKLGVDYSLTHSCYDPMIDGRPCQQCDSCLLRAKGFLDADVCDPIL